LCTKSHAAAAYTSPIFRAAPSPEILLPTQRADILLIQFPLVIADDERGHTSDTSSLSCRLRRIDFRASVAGFTSMPIVFEPTLPFDILMTRFLPDARQYWLVSPAPRQFARRILPRRGHHRFITQSSASKSRRQLMKHVSLKTPFSVATF
jgi:hypothetical protein